MPSTMFVGTNIFGKKKDRNRKSDFNNEDAVVFTVPEIVMTTPSGPMSQRGIGTNSSESST